jgi:acetate kinase
VVVCRWFSASARVDAALTIRKNPGRALMNPQILVINSGSSSLKFSLLDPESANVSASGIAERLSTKEATLKLNDLSGEKQEEGIPGADHRIALLHAIKILSKNASLEISAIGHRVVHGGEYFKSAALVTEEVVQRIEELTSLAPLHNPAAIQGLKVVSELFPGKPQVVVFDTAFHQTLPPYAFHYAIPSRYYQQFRVRRYGFHGTSHHYVGQQAAARLGRPFDQLQLISAHLGNGCSATAIRFGKSVDTTMGLTPLEGVAMGTRSGDVDPNLHLFLHNAAKLSLQEITDQLNRESGLLGVSGISHDMRTVAAAAEQGNSMAALAIELFCYRAARAMLGLAAGLTAIDAVIFTGGIGENNSDARARIVDHLAVLGPQLDPVRNAHHGRNSNGKITHDEGLQCLVIPTNEELMIAKETRRITEEIIRNQ